jgi:hypothetical protein
VKGSWLEAADVFLENIALGVWRLEFGGWRLEFGVWSVEVALEESLARSELPPSNRF